MSACYRFSENLVSSERLVEAYVKVLFTQFNRQTKTVPSKVHTDPPPPALSQHVCHISSASCVIMER